MSRDEGYIKFNCDWDRESIIEVDGFSSLNRIRTALWDMGLIGVYDTGIGYGNISMRVDGEVFLITGSRTGAKRQLSIDDYSLVVDFDISKNYVHCRGLVEASSESMTHAAIYRANELARLVVHVHSSRMWEFLRGQLPTTSEDAEFGTPQIAMEVSRIARQLQGEFGIIVLGGHKDGLLFYSSQLGW